MLKINKKIIFFSIIILITLFTNIVFARRIGEFSRFRVSFWGDRTGFLLKEGSDGSDYVLNLWPSRELAAIKIKNYLINKNGSMRSYNNLLECGKRGTFSNWASRGYSYALKMHRENWWDRSYKYNR